jgi:hypothetical protein
MEKPFRLRPRLGARVKQQLTPGPIALSSRTELQCPVELSKGRNSGSKRLIDRIATHRPTEIQGSERGAGVTKALQADYQFGGNLASGELIAILGPTLVLEAA